MKDLYSSQQEKISHYNSFRVFEKIYGSASSTNQPDRLEKPAEKYFIQKTFSYYVFLFIFVVCFALLVHPLLSYFLKTPYPLIVISDDSSVPYLKRGDIILSKGIVSFQSIQPDDLIVCYDMPSAGEKTFSVFKVKQISSDYVILTGIKEGSLEKTVDKKNISGMVIGNQQPWRLPRVGYLILWWSGMARFLGLDR